MQPGRAELDFLHQTRRCVMPIENLIVLGIVGAGMLAFAAVTLWLTTESGAQRKRESHIAPAE
jgi:hypothetical protein